jgi:hypothetical protein
MCCVHADTLARPCRASVGVWGEGGGEGQGGADARLCPHGRRGASARTGSRLHGRERLTPDNCITDATMRPSHGRPSGCRSSVCPSVRPSAIVRMTTLGWGSVVLFIFKILIWVLFFPGCYSARGWFYFASAMKVLFYLGQKIIIIKCF